MNLPKLRYQQAGATPQEIERAEAEFDLLPASAQQSRLDYLAGISNYDLAASIADARQSEAEEPEPAAADDPAADEPTPDPPSTSASAPTPISKLAGSAPAGKGAGPADGETPAA